MNIIVAEHRLIVLDEWAARCWELKLEMSLDRCNAADKSGEISSEHRCGTKNVERAFRKCIVLDEEFCRN